MDSDHGSMRTPRGVARWNTLVGMALVMGPATVAGQERIEVVGETPTCACRMTLEHVVTLGDTEGPGMLLGEVREVRRNSEGVFHVLAWNEHQIYRFRPDGSALPAVFREGEGPGEAIRITKFVIVDDSVVAFDPGNARITVLDPDGDVARTVTMIGHPEDGAYVPAKGFVLNTKGFETATYGMTLHRFDSDGARVGSFGGRPEASRDRGLSWVRRLALADGAVWSAYTTRYVMEEWSLDGEHVRTVERDAEWFAPRAWDEQSWGGPDEPMKPSILDVDVVEEGYLRVLLRRGGPQWAQLLPPPIRRSMDGSMVYPPEPGIGLFESIIEIIDPATGQLFAKGTFEPELYGFVDRDHAFSYAVDAVGNPTISIWRLSLSP